MGGIKDGSTVLVSGFAQIGEPRALVDGLIEQGAKELTVVHNTAGRGREGVARLIGEGRFRKIVCSFARSRRLGAVRGGLRARRHRIWRSCRRARSPSASAPAVCRHPGLLTPTGGGTLLATGKRRGSSTAAKCILEQAIVGDVALAEAWPRRPLWATSSIATPGGTSTRVCARRRQAHHRADAKHRRAGSS